VFYEEGDGDLCGNFITKAHDIASRTLVLLELYHERKSSNDLLGTTDACRISFDKQNFRC